MALPRGRGLRLIADMVESDALPFHLGNGEDAMPKSEIATDSAKTLRKLTGDDATATFEDDPKFVESNPTGNASSENVEVQRDTDDLDDSDEEEEDDEDIDEDDEDDLEDEEEEEDEDDEDDEEEDDDDEDEEEEDDADEVAASPAMLAAGSQVDEEEDDDDGDVDQGVDEDALDEDDLDTDQVAAAGTGYLSSLLSI